MAMATRATLRHALQVCNQQLRPITLTPPSTFHVPNAAFSTTPWNYDEPVKKKSPLSKGVVFQKKHFQMSKKRNKQKRGAAQAKKSTRIIGEQRRQIRRTVVLTNDNALEVADISRLDKQALEDADLAGKMMRLPDTVVDQLRAVEAFKSTQGWKYFRHPSVIMTKEAVHMVDTVKRITDSSTPETLRSVVIGAGSSGKSILLLQSMAAAFLKGWIVVNIPYPVDLVNAGIDYSPIDNTSPVQYRQKTFSAQLLSQLVTANGPLLASLKTTMPHPALAFPHRDTTLKRLCDLGVQNDDIAWPIFLAVWKELTKPSPTTPPIMYVCDGVNALMTTSAYFDPAVKPIHAHDLAHVAHFMAHLSGAAELSNGGMVLAAPCTTGTKDIPSMSHSLSNAEARQNGQDVTQWPAYERGDERVLRTLRDVNVTRVRGLDQDEARTVLNYWAASGMVRNVVDNKFVAEKWGLAGNGNIGQMEKVTVRVPTKAPAQYK